MSTSQEPWVSLVHISGTLLVVNPPSPPPAHTSFPWSSSRRKLSGGASARVRWPTVKAHPFHSPAVWPWASDLPSLSLSFLLGKNVIVIGLWGLEEWLVCLGLVFPEVDCNARIQVQVQKLYSEIETQLQVLSLESDPRRCQSGSEMEWDREGKAVGKRGFVKEVPTWGT